MSRTAWVVPFENGPFTMPDPAGMDRIVQWGRVHGPWPNKDGLLTCINWIEPSPQHEAAVMAEMAANPDYVRLPDE